MSDIELVIKIPEKIYKYVQQIGSINMLDTQQVANVIFDGTPLPKGHGRLIDADAISLDDISFFSITDYQKMVSKLNAPTIIEADNTRDCKNCAHSNGELCAGTEV